MSFDSAEEWLSQVSSDVKISQKDKSRVISITGGKGGVGKSSLGIKLALTLAEMGKKVLLVDSDVNLSNIAVKLGEPLTDHFFELLSSQKDFESCLIRRKNLDILPGCNGNIEIFKGDLTLDKILIDIIETHRQNYDYVLVDSPAGLSPLTLNLNSYSDDRFVIVNPDNSSMTDAYSLMKLLSKNFGAKEFHLIVNKVSNSRQYYKVVKGLGDTVDRFLHSRLNILGTIPFFNIPADEFDRRLFSAEKSSIDRDFIHIVQKYSEEHSKWDISEGALPFPSTINFEQEVHHIC